MAQRRACRILHLWLAVRWSRQFVPPFLNASSTCFPMSVSRVASGGK
jgi:hypothetical protein